MNESSPPPAAGSGPGGPRRRGLRRAAAGLVAVCATLLGAAPSAFAVTSATAVAGVGLKAVGPTSAEHGFPTWYQDGNNLRVEPCLEPQNPYCGFLPGDVPDPEQPISFPDNFPDEMFYTLAGSTLTLTTGGRAVLTSGLEAAFVNGVAPGGQQVFTRIRIVVTGAAPNSHYRFKHPYGTVEIDTDGTGKGRLVRDVAPSVGNFTLALKGDVGPFLQWTDGAPAGYLGDPAVTHAVKGGPNGNTFEAFDGTGAQVGLTDQFSVQGKISTNTGVTADSAVVNGSFVDVFAHSAGSALEVVGQDGKFATTPMVHDDGTERFYARVPFTGSAPADITVRNAQDNPVSTSKLTIQGITVAKAEYDGANLTVTATASGAAAYPLTVEGVGELTDGNPKAFPIGAPPASITVSSGTVKTTVPVVISGGAASPAGTTPPPAGGTVDPTCQVGDATSNGPCPTGGTGTGTGTGTTTAPVVAVASQNLTAPRGVATVVDGSTTTGATSYSTTVKTVPTGVDPKSVVITNGTTNKPSVTLPMWAAISDTSPKLTNGSATTADTSAFTVTFTATNAVGSTSKDVTIRPAAETLTPGNARYQSGKDLRVTGTSAVTGVTGALNPQSNVVVYLATATGNWVKIGTSPVDTTGAWSVRPTPVPTVAYTRYLVQSSRGGVLTGTLQLR